jgi:predicted outer membrane repeat protein
MKHSLLTTLIAVLFAGNSLSITYYIISGGTGSGLSWYDASGDLPAVLFSANPGDEIWVAKGIYLPTKDNNRRKSFIIPAGVKLFGGFAGNETILSQRKVRENTTILSGNIGQSQSFLDNSTTVVIISGGNDQTLIDGFVICDGTADGTGAPGSEDRSGGGLYINGSTRDFTSAPQIRNCIFQNNYARDGGAVYINAQKLKCHPTFQNCQFNSNRSDLDGGAIFNDGRYSGEANPVFIDCHFVNNEGNYGGAICNYGGKGESNPSFMNCLFQGNEAYLRGRAIYNMDVEGKASPVVNNCRFVDNKATLGQGMYTFSKPELKKDVMPTNYKLN